jgi:GTPase SAR1 family protein
LAAFPARVIAKQCHRFFIKFKVVLIGSVAVGKTFITNHLQFSQSEEECEPTVDPGYVTDRGTFNEQVVEL